MKRLLAITILILSAMTSRGSVADTTSIYDIEKVEIHAQKYSAPIKLDFLTRMPLRPSEQIQNISVISQKIIMRQGNLTLSDAARNVVGISTFATYGGASESLSARGFRGIPILKNGVRIHSDFRGYGSLIDMQGVESIQVIKGSAAVTQGIGNDIGSAGGTVNIATKTPHFVNSAAVSLRTGSWGLVRPTFDLQYAPSSKVAFRFNGAFERSDSYRKHVTKDKIYVNPSMKWRLAPGTSLTLEMDYLHDSRTPDRGTVNLAADSIDALYTMPHNKFLGFKSDRVFTDQTTYTLRMEHALSDKLSLRFAAVGSSLNVDNTGASTSKLFKNKDYNMLTRSLGRSLRDDQNRVMQLDFIGRDVFTGKIKHTFQVGFDYKYATVGTTNYASIVVDTINVLNSFTNSLPQNIKLTPGEETIASSYNYGVMVQDVVTLNRYLKAVLGARYNFATSKNNTASGTTVGNAFNPVIGLIATPFAGFNIFGSFTNTTDLRSAANLKEDGSPIGASMTQQFETGIKSNWLNDRLHFNLTLFSVKNANLAYQTYNDAGQTTGRYEQAGDLTRKGIEAELTGSPLKNLDIIFGYAYLDAQYHNSPAYIDGSAPMNAPKHTANAWAYYTLPFGLHIGMGAYYVGERPVGDYTKKTTHLNTTPNVKPFDMKAFTTLNATLKYSYKKVSVNLFFNNILNTLGYSSYYRGGFINPIDPFNFSTTIAYQF